jgi:type I restriction enzyme S subunit
MRKLPAGWEYRRVDQVGDVQLGRQRSPAMMSGPYMRPYLRVANVLDGYIDYSDVLEMNFAPHEAQTFNLQPGDVLINEGQALDLVGRCAIFDGPPGMCFQNTLLRFRPRTVLPKFAAAIFKHWLDHGEFRKITRQTTSIAHLGSAQFAAMHFPYASLKEQQRISEILDSADELIRHGESLVLKQKIIEDGIIENLLKDRSGGESSLDELSSPERGSMTIGPFGSNLVAADYQDSGVSVVFVQDIQSGSYRNVSGVHVSAAKARNLAAHAVRSGDLLLTKMGLPPCVAAVYPPGSLDAIITADILRIRPDADKVNPYWLANAINQERFRHQVRGITGGVTRPKVTLRDVRRLRIVVPSLREQQESVAIIEGARHQRTGTEEALTKMRQLRQGVMDDLLTGRVRVAVLYLGVEFAWGRWPRTE